MSRNTNVNRKEAEKRPETQIIINAATQIAHFSLLYFFLPLNHAAAAASGTSSGVIAPLFIICAFNFDRLATSVTGRELIY